jgi:acetyltransferase EpsM
MTPDESGSRLLVLGTTTFPMEVAGVAREAGFRVEGFVAVRDDQEGAGPVEGLQVHPIQTLQQMMDTHQVVCGVAIGRREVVARAAGLGARFATVVHPTARIPATGAVGTGTVVNAGVILGAHARVGAHAVLNRGALIGHHTEIGDYAFVGPGANVAGETSVGEGVWVGVGAVVIDEIRVGAHSKIGAGAVVVRDVPERTLVVGVPARVIREGITESTL